MTDIDIDAIRQRAGNYAKTPVGSHRTILAIGLANEDVPLLLAKVDELTAALVAFQPLAYSGGEQLFVHECRNVEWWNEQEQGPINDQGCDACESSPFTGGWQPVYARTAVAR